MSDRIDFTDRGIVTIYENVSSENVSALQDFIEEMASLSQRHQYKPLMDFTNNIIDFYENDFRSHVMHCFEQWDSSDFSIDRLALRCGAGQDAANTGRQYMEELRSALGNMFNRSFGRVRTETDSPVLDDKDILKANENINTLINRSVNIKDDAVSQCSSRADQNMVYILLKPVIENTGESMVECFKNMINRVEEGTDLYRQGIRSVVDSIQKGSLIDSKGPVWPAYDGFI